MWRVLVLVSILLGCSSGEAPRKASLDVLRIGSHFGLAPITPWVAETLSGNLLYLVYSPAEECFSSMRPAGSEWLLTRKPACPYSPAKLARALRHRDLQAARAAPDGVLATLSRAPLLLSDFTLDLGPYEQESFQRDRLVLRRRAGHGARRIEVTTMRSSDEEWHRFLARAVDVIPVAFPQQLKQVADVPSVRIVDVKAPATTAIYFQLAKGPCADVRLRRAISLGLRRRAIAHVSTGNDEDAIPAEESFEAAKRALAALAPQEPIRLLSDKGSADHQRAVLVIEEQLLELGLSVELQALEAADFVRTFNAGDWDLVFFLGGTAPRYLDRLESSTHPNAFGYVNPAFDQALARGDVATAQKILAHDVPVTPIYRVREGIAIDGRLCGAHPAIGSNLSWLADVHLCAPGELE